MKVLLTGVTGYIGGRLVSKLLEEGHDVRVLVRDAKRIAGRTWTSKVEVITGDLVLNRSLRTALEGIDTAYYLVHSMLAGPDFENLDRMAAKNFVKAATKLRHTIYLGGLVPKSQNISHHLKSRAEVGQILRDSIPTTEFRAGPIIGSGSASFEMLRHLTERLPLIIAPKWIINEIQPIAVRDILSYLLAALTNRSTGIIEVGADRVNFIEMIKIFAEVRGLRRRIWPVPILTPNLASRWVALVTPIPNSIAVPIIEGISHPLLADTKKAEMLFPSIKPITYRKAVELALVKLQTGEIETRWSNALGKFSDSYSLENVQGMIREIRSLKVNASQSSLFQSFVGLGGKNGWLSWSWAWKVRGLFDRIIGGPGLHRGRRHATEAFVGEAIDFWRVEAVAPNRLLRLRAEMKLPGRAWIEWQALSESGTTTLIQVASFAPKGLAGLIYWYCLYPIHSAIFSNLVKAIARNAEKAFHGKSS